MKSTLCRLLGITGALVMLLFLLGAAGVLTTATGCGGSGTGDQTDTGDDTGMGATIDYAVEGDFSLTGTDAKTLIFSFDRDLQGILDERYIAITDAAGERVPVELVWLSARMLRLAAPLHFASAYTITFFSTPLQTSASVAKDAAAPLLSVDITTGHNPRDVDGDEMADVALLNGIFRPATDFSSPAAFLLLGSELVADALIGEDHNLSRSTGWWRRYATSDLDNEGNRRDRIARLAAVVGDINADGRAEFAVGERVFDPATGEPSDRLLIYSGADPSTPIAAFVPEGEGGSNMLQGIIEVLPAGDMDGDGIADMLISARENRDVAAYILGVFKGRAGLSGEIPWAPESFFALITDEGRVDSIATLSDFNGDRISDLALSIFKEAAPVKSLIVDPIAAVFEPAGVRIHLGSADPAALATADMTITGAEERFGVSIAAGDVDGDTLSDLLIGAPMAVSTDGSGKAYLMPGSAAVADRASEAAVLVLGLPDDDEGAYSFGTSVAVANLSSAAYADMLVGAPQKNRVLLYAGGPDADATPDALLYNNLREGFRNQGKLMADPGAGTTGPVPYDRFGLELLFLGDADNDGYEDVMAAGSAAVVREVCEYPVIGYQADISFQVTVNTGDQNSCLGTLDQVEAMTQACLGGVDCTVQSGCSRAVYWNGTCTPSGWGLCGQSGYDPDGSYHYNGTDYRITLAPDAGFDTCWTNLNAAAAAIEALSTPTVAVSRYSYGCSPLYADQEVCSDVDDPVTRNQRFGCVFAGDPGLGDENRRMSCTGSEAVIKDFTNTRLSAGGAK